MAVAELGEEVLKRRARDRGTPDWNSWAQWVTVTGGPAVLLITGEGR